MISMIGSVTTPPAGTHFYVGRFVEGLEAGYRLKRHGGASQAALPLVEPLAFPGVRFISDCTLATPASRNFAPAFARC